MTPADHDYLRKLLKECSGLVLAADKQYLVESRLLPVAHRAGIGTLAELVEKLRGVKNGPLVTEVVEATDGELAVPGRVYIAPGGRHLRVVRRDGVPSVALDDGPQINFCKPAVDPMFSSAAEAWGGWNLALVLTGIGSDGTRGAADIVAAGGSVIAQDEETSVVWGMPGSVTKAGLCCAVLPIDQIAAKLTNLFSGGRS